MLSSSNAALLASHGIAPDVIDWGQRRYPYGVFSSSLFSVHIRRYLRIVLATGGGGKQGRRIASSANAASIRYGPTFESLAEISYIRCSQWRSMGLAGIIPRLILLICNCVYKGWNVVII